MDASSDARLAEQSARRGAGHGVVNSPNILRSSRSMEHRSLPDAQLRLFPTYEDEDDRLQTLHEQPQNEQTLASPVTEKKPLALQVATQLSGRDIMADLQYTERKQAERNHIIMLNL
ncbi:expressed unknown protein [Seminavis robusta]|uniref:Uncharacterized protein n=1 Tax=Seminavis robusta TaxID=568900 RepID=A0A9N8E9L2_9STRA|nr:expressed unknown protein [Seminavis robusta]|eukprot:Sro847_g210370.1 n/a (117) ;mRNA; f:39778-40128